MKRLLIVGHGRSGKDEAGNWLDANTDATFGGSTSVALCEHVAAELRMSVEECYRTRHEHSATWKRVGKMVRQHDPAILIRTMLERGNVIAGVRDKCEVLAARDQGLVDLIVWVDNPRVPADFTVEFTAADCDIVIMNEATLAIYHARWARLAKALGF